MDKRLKGYAENCMKLLETLDGLQINSGGTDGEQVIFFPLQTRDYQNNIQNINILLEHPIAVFEIIEK